MSEASTSKPRDSAVRNAREVAEAAARNSYGKLIALLAGRTNDVAGAEDALSDAFATAIAVWPERGIPSNPEGWLLTVARRKRIDAARRQRTTEAASDHLRLMADEIAAAAEESTGIPDERLGLMFACAHPAIDRAIRAPLILQAVLGFDAATIGSSFLISPATMAQRLVRAKKKIRDAGIPFHIPEGPQLAERLDAVLEAIYATFAEGWADPAGTDTRRCNLAEEGIALGQLVASLLPNEPEALALLSLMLYAHARREARRDAQGNYVPLADQDPARWDLQLIQEAEALLARANALPGIGRYQLEAAVQSAHAARRFTGTSDWSAIERLYEALLRIAGSPVIALNHAVAIAEVHDPAQGLQALDRLADDKRLAHYQPYWAARAELLTRSGDHAAADDAYSRAIGLEIDPAVRDFLQRRRSRLGSKTS